MPSVDSLPNEVLVAIFRLVDPPPPIRRRPSHALYSCCLVSRRWRECAEPLLWHGLVLSEQLDLGPLLKSERVAAMLKQVRTLSVSDRSSMRWRDSIQLADVETSEKLQLVGGYDFPFLPALQRLCLQRIELRRYTMPLSLPHLTTLVLDTCTLFFGDARAFFTAEALPSLRSLSLGHVTVVDSHGEEVAADTIGRNVLPLDFISRLDIVQLRVCAATAFLLKQWTLESSTATRGRPNILIAASVNDVSEAWNLHLHQYITHLALEPGSSQPSQLDRFRRMLGYLRPTQIWETDYYREYSIRQLVFSCHNLVTALLPLELRDASPPSSKVALHRDAVLEACEERRVEVLWADGPFDEEADGRGSALPREEFARWVRGKRAEKEGGRKNA